MAAQLDYIKTFGNASTQQMGVWEKNLDALTSGQLFGQPLQDFATQLASAVSNIGIVDVEGQLATLNQLLPGLSNQLADASKGPNGLSADQIRQNAADEYNKYQGLIDATKDGGTISEQLFNSLNEDIQGFFDIPVDHLFASRIFLPYLKKRNFQNLCLASPDTGGTKRAVTYAKYLDASLAIGYKQRPRPNVIGSLQIIGDVKDKEVVLVDDIIDTAGTICKAADAIKELGAKSVRAMCVHPVFSGKAYENIERSAIEEVITTDTIPLRQKCDKITVLSVDKLFATAIESIVAKKSINKLFDFDHFINLDDMSL